MKTYQALGALLTYPTGPLREAGADILEVIDREDALSPRVRNALTALVDEIRRGDLIDAQERYVDLFDRVRSLSLHLFEHVHGESRDRGQAMVDLKALYERHGMALATDELPDYVPAFLEFLSILPDAEARPLLAETTHLLEAIGARLKKRGNAYAAVFSALLELAGAADASAEQVPDAEIAAEDDPATLDAQWAEQPAFDGASCGSTARQDGTSVIKIHRRAA